jgi:hypothetical protein
MWGTTQISQRRGYRSRLGPRELAGKRSDLADPSTKLDYNTIDKHIAITFTSN